MTEKTALEAKKTKTSYQTHCYLITSQTNLHVGAGDANYGVVDKQVQRDHNTNLPNIHASSLKGGLREYFEENTTLTAATNHIFGSKPDEKINLANGKYRFYDANLLFLPIRSSHNFYYLATCKSVMQEFKRKLELFGIKTAATGVLLSAIDAIVKVNVDPAQPQIINKEQKVYLEDWVTTSISKDNKAITKLEVKLGNKIAILHNKDFKELADNLPVIARNQLENGTSQNLWYEEVVPRESIFVTFVSVPNEEHLSDFNTELEGNGTLIQIGANATIGYGICKFEKLPPLPKKTIS